jgi:hypothetical protein
MLKRFVLPARKLKLKAQLPNPMGYPDKFVEVKMLLKIMRCLLA